MRKAFLVAVGVLAVALPLGSLAASAPPEANATDQSASNQKGSEQTDQRARDQKTWASELETWRAQRAANLQAPEGWLSLIGLEWLREGDNSFGSDADNRIQIVAKTSAHIGVVRLEKGALRLLASGSGFPKDFLVDGKPAQEMPLVADDAEKPSKLTIGTITIIVINRDGRFALRIKDPQAPTRVGFHRVAMVCAERELSHSRTLDSLQPAQSARYSDRSWNHDTPSSAGRGGVHD